MVNLSLALELNHTRCMQLGRSRSPRYHYLDLKEEMKNVEELAISVEVGWYAPGPGASAFL